MKKQHRPEKPLTLNANVVRELTVVEIRRERLHEIIGASAAYCARGIVDPVTP
jgi:hypothetical protein